LYVHVDFDICLRYKSMLINQNFERLFVVDLKIVLNDRETESYKYV